MSKIISLFSFVVVLALIQNSLSEEVVFRECGKEGILVLNLVINNYK